MRFVAIASVTLLFNYYLFGSRSIYLPTVGFSCTALFSDESKVLIAFITKDISAMRVLSNNPTDFLLTDTVITDTEWLLVNSVIITAKDRPR